jgi:uncharacterized cupredoxin-like copper-binding protein
MKRNVMAAFIVAMAAAGTAWSHGDAGKAKDKPRAISVEEHAFGRQGDPKKVTRSVRIDMADTMRYSPAEIVVKRGDTIRFEVKNAGKTMHEMVIGTMKALKEHAELMRKHPGMEHDEPYMAHVAPGKRERIVWQFTKAGEFYYGCLIPGHFEAGMIGRVIVK